MMRIVLALIVFVCAVDALSFQRIGKNRPDLARKYLLGLPKTSYKTAVPCDVCVSFFDADLNTILNIILQVGIEGTCQDVCTKLPSPTEQDICEVLCLVGGFREFLKVLSNDDLDPIYICAELDACKKNTCNGVCTQVVSASVSPNSAPLRSKFLVHAQVRALNTTGVGVTVFSWPCVSSQCQSSVSSVEVLNDGLEAGQSIQVSLELHTAEQEWQYQPHTYPVTVTSCGSDCSNIHGTIFSVGYTNFTVTQRK